MSKSGPVSTTGFHSMIQSIGGYNWASKTTHSVTWTIPFENHHAHHQKHFSASTWDSSLAVEIARLRPNDLWSDAGWLFSLLAAVWCDAFLPTCMNNQNLIVVCSDVFIYLFCIFICIFKDTVYDWVLFNNEYWQPTYLPSYGKFYGVESHNLSFKTFINLDPPLYGKEMLFCFGGKSLPLNQQLDSLLT